MASQAERDAKQRWVGWIRYYQHYDDRGRRSDVLSQAEVARRLGFSPSALNQLVNTPNRFPSFETLLATRKMTGWSLDQLLLSTPPTV